MFFIHKNYIQIYMYIQRHTEFTKGKSRPENVETLPFSKFFWSSYFQCVDFTLLYLFMSLSCPAPEPNLSRKKRIHIERTLHVVSHAILTLLTLTI